MLAEFKTKKEYHTVQGLTHIKIEGNESADKGAKEAIVMVEVATLTRYHPRVPYGRLSNYCSYITNK